MLSFPITFMLATIFVLSTVANSAGYHEEIGQQQQQASQQHKRENIATMAKFESMADGFSVGVPNGWIVDDINNTQPAVEEHERQFDAGVLALLCPQNQAIRETGGTFVCPQEMQGVVIVRYSNLQSRPAFADIIRSNKNISTSDLLAFHLQFLQQRFGNKNITILNNTDMTVNVTDSKTNQTIGKASAKYIEITYTDILNRIVPRDIALLVLSGDGNTAYVLLGSAESAMTIGRLPYEQQQIFDSFSLLSPAPSVKPPEQNRQPIAPQQRSL